MLGVADIKRIARGQLNPGGVRLLSWKWFVSCRALNWQWEDREFIWLFPDKDVL